MPVCSGAAKSSFPKPRGHHFHDPDPERSARMVSYSEIIYLDKKAAIGQVAFHCHLVTAFNME
jgi:hypothetical protein